MTSSGLMAINAIYVLITTKFLSLSRTVLLNTSLVYPTSISIWMSSRHLKANKPQTELLPFLSKIYSQSSPFQYQTKKLGVILYFSLSLTPYTKIYQQILLALLSKYIWNPTNSYNLLHCHPGPCHHHILLRLLS